MTPEVLESWLRENAFLAFLPFVGWVVLVGVVIGVFRKRRGWSVFRTTYPAPLFSESWTTSGRGLFMANRCAWVTLTRDVLHVALHFPFWTMFPFFMARRMGLEGKVPLERIVRIVGTEPTLLGAQAVSVTWRDEDVTRTLAVSPHDHAGFLAALERAARAKGATV